jgi:hypothetical protein
MSTDASGPVELEWIFDPVPASGARSGGDPSAFVFEATLETFVREILQNSTDQRLDEEEPVRVRLVLDELQQDRLQRFHEIFRWAELQRHVRGVLAVSGPTERSRFERVHEGGGERLLVLWVEDRNTTGLTGPEAGEGSFAALCRDRLFSDKLQPGAGGSFGLGKAVLWRFSRWSTVAFCSRLAGPEGRLRFIAKAALPWHKVGRTAFAGEGWLGSPSGSETRRHAASVWDEAALGVVAGLGAEALPEGTSGTAIGVVGFEEPAAEEPCPLPELAGRLWRAAEQSFWPAMALGQLQVEVEVRGSPAAEPPPAGPWQGLFEAYLRGHDRPRLTEPGHVLVHPLAVKLPAERSEEGAPVTATADLVVRLSVADEPHVNELLCFRGAGMVVERRRLDRLSATARPFHALLVCGRARRALDEPDDVLERFLRDAEPPSHDRWISTPRLKERWRRGYAVALDNLWREAVEALRKLAVPPVIEREDGPVGLRKLFPLPAGAGGGRPESAFRFRDLQAELAEDGRWRFRGKVGPSVPVEGGWSVRVDARVPEEGGLGVGALVASIETEGGTARVEGGIASIEAPPGTSEVRFSGQTEPSRFPVAPERACFELVVTGRVEP